MKLKYPFNSTVNGIDVSKYKWIINWKKVKTISIRLFLIDLYMQTVTKLSPFLFGMSKRDCK